jgi:hypothetical protein
MNDVPESEMLEGGPISLAAFIQLRDTDGGDVIVNVAEIKAVFAVIGRAAAASPDGTKSRLLLREGVNIPLVATIEEVSALLSSVAIVAGPVAEDPTYPQVVSPRLYTPSDDRG